jgi:cation:H+ antiporter
MEPTLAWEKYNWNWYSSPIVLGGARSQLSRMVCSSTRGVVRSLESFTMLYLTLAFGFILLIAGGEMLVRGAVSVAQRFWVSPMLIGVTLVGFGTSTPELVTSLQAAFDGLPGIAVGNVVGSNIANILLILGVAALIVPIAVTRKSFQRDGIALMLATMLCLGVVLWGAMDRWLGAVLVAGLVGYLVFACLNHEGEDGEAQGPSPSGWFGAVMLAVAGIEMAIAGAWLAVGAAVDLAALWGVGETVIGLTVVAIGTSLPELVTSVVAAWRGQSAIAFGNVVGSNIYNILGIMGIMALLRPISVPPQIAVLDIWVMVVATLTMIGLIVMYQRIGRWAGATLLVAYAAYSFVLLG